MKLAFSDRWRILRSNIHEFSEKVTASLEVSKTRKQIIVLDGLRAFACLAVIFYHINLWGRIVWHPLHGIYNILDPILTFGESGVDLFFLLSGFLLFLPYAKSLLFDSTWPSLRRFYLRRVFRIIPAYYITLFLMILFFNPKLFHHNFWSEIGTFLTFRMSFMLSQDVNGSFWTLAVEFQFYLLLPLIAWLFGLLVRRGSMRWRMITVTLCLCAMIIWGVATRYWGQYLADTTALDFLIPHRLVHIITTYIYSDRGKFFEVFAIGMFLAVVYTYTQHGAARERWEARLRRLSLWLLGVGVGLLFFLSVIRFYLNNVDVATRSNSIQMYTFLDPYMVPLSNSWQLFYPLAYGISYGLCMAAILYGSDRLKRPFEWPLLRWIGFISFSLYMWHQPFIVHFFYSIGGNLVSQGFRPIVEYGALYVWVLVVVFPLALASYRWIEMPGMRVGEYIIRRLDKKRGQGKASERQEEREGALQPVGGR
jgi:peptidoglycan/LPS O-acetylase OafA/YrhL